MSSKLNLNKTMKGGMLPTEHMIIMKKTISAIVTYAAILALCVTIIFGISRTVTTQVSSDEEAVPTALAVGSMPSATESNIYLLARIISAEARGETYTGQVAVGAVILNRVKHPSFPDTLSGVIYQGGAFTAIVDGQFNEPISDTAYNAARDCLNGWDPTGGAIYYYNPAKTSNAFMHSRPIITTIGSHRFCS